MNKVFKYFYSPFHGNVLVSVDYMADLGNIKLSTKEGANSRLSMTKITMSQESYSRFIKTFEEQFGDL